MRPSTSGLPTAITFTNGVATVSGSNNGVMKLYKAETANIVVSDGTYNNGTGLTVTVNPLAASKLLLAAATTTPAAGAADNLTITAQDTYGNTATSYTGSQEPDLLGRRRGRRQQPDGDRQLGVRPSASGLRPRSRSRTASPRRGATA